MADEKQRVDFMKACLTKLGLEVSRETEAVPSLSRLHLSSSKSSDVAELLQSWTDAGLLTRDEHGRETIKGENDTFIIQEEGRFDLDRVKDALPSTSSDSEQQNGDEGKPSTNSRSSNSPELLDYNSVRKTILTHESCHPDGKSTPYFNHHAYYANLKHYHTTLSPGLPQAFGRHLLYGEVVTSTQSMLEKNPSFLSQLPDGFTATATTQVAGRGRGTNVWVSPPGTLAFSTVLKHGLALSATAPVVFIQYLAALAIVSGIQEYDKGGYDRIPVKLKWPNDIYALDPKSPTSGPDKKYVKIGGILVNSSYSGSDYTLVLGIGLNVTNLAGPTTSLAHLAKKLALPAFTLEKLLASILSHFEALHARFVRTGWDREFEARYYRHWLHTDQIVTLETEAGARARIKGITRDWGLLVAEELGWEDRATGRKWELQSDSNSFDFFKGLLKRKV